MMKQPVYQPGTIIAGRYRVDKAIARGGCSIVYRGTHLEMERPVALKLMSSMDGQIDRAWVERFKREARLASQLHHPNTITIYDYGASQGVLFITMEWVEGDSLRNVIKAHGAMAPKRVAKLAIHLLSSLAEAHRFHILHRDLKPSNIMLTRDLEGQEMIKVLDFGLAKANPPGYTNPEQLKLTKDGDFVGTPRYAAPEQLRGKELTRASDIYGVGMVMWEMLTGKPAVPDVDFGTCVLHHLGPNPWKLPPEIRCPEPLARIVERALLKDAMARYQNCEEMLAELEQLLGADAGGPDRSNQSQERALFGPEGGHARQIDLGAVAPATPPKAATPPPQPAAAEPPLQVAPQQEQLRSFDQVSAHELELDRRAEPVKPRPAPGHATPSPAAPMRHTDDATPKWLKVAGAGLMLVIVLGGGAFAWRHLQSSKTTAEPTPSPQASPEIAAPAPATPTDEPPPREVIRALLLLKKAGWSYLAQDGLKRDGCLVHQIVLKRAEPIANIELRSTRCDDAAKLKDPARGVWMKHSPQLLLEFTPGDNTERSVAVELKDALERLAQPTPSAPPAE